MAARSRTHEKRITAAKALTFPNQDRLAVQNTASCYIYHGEENIRPGQEKNSQKDNQKIV